MHTRLLFVLATLVFLFGLPARAGDLATPTGPVVLTVAGAVSQTNRPPFDPFEDAFTKYHEKTFERAAAFDRAMLEALGMHQAELRFETWPKAYRFEGPRLRDVLAAAGARGETVTAIALDGFATEIPRALLEAEDWMVAVKRDGRYLDLGQRGPLWILYPPRGGRAPTHDDEGRWPWSVFMILVE